MRSATQISDRPLTECALDETVHPLVFRAIAETLLGGDDVHRVTAAEERELAALGVLVDGSQIAARPRLAVPGVDSGTAARLRATGEMDLLAQVDAGDRARFQKSLDGDPGSVWWHQGTPTAIINPWRAASAGDAPIVDDGRAVDDARAGFARIGLAALPSGLPASQLAALRDYYGALITQGWMRLGDGFSHRY